MFRVSRPYRKWPVEQVRVSPERLASPDSGSLQVTSRVEGAGGLGRSQRVTQITKSDTPILTLLFER